MSLDLDIANLRDLYKNLGKFLLKACETTMQKRLSQNKILNPEENGQPFSRLVASKFLVYRARIFKWRISHWNTRKFRWITLANRINTWSHDFNSKTLLTSSFYSNLHWFLLFGAQSCKGKAVFAVKKTLGQHRDFIFFRTIIHKYSYNSW